MNNQPMMTVQQVADKFGLNSRTILREIKKGNIRAHRVGRKFFISTDSLEKYSGYKSGEGISSVSNIQKFCHARKQEMVDLLQKLVSIPSESETQSEERLAHFLKQKLESLGIRTVLHGRGESITVQATFGYANRGILLDCALDTTPAGDLQKWTYPPYEGVIREGKMFGRGTADCKGGMVAMIYTLLALKEFVDERKVRVEVVFDGGEQNGVYLGMRTTLNKGLPVDGGIIGYAGEPGRILIGARGYHRYTFMIHGISVHTGSSSKRGVNAILKTVKFIDEMEQTSLPRSRDKYFPFGSKFTFSTIEGGRAINMVPDECKVRLDVRTVPSLTKKDVDLWIQRVIQKLKKKDKDFAIDFTYDVGEEGYVVPEKEKIVTALSTAYTETVHKKPDLVASGPAHIGNLLYKHEVPVVVRGPVGGNVHSYDEYVVLDSLPLTAEIYSRTILKFFGIRE